MASRLQHRASAAILAAGFVLAIAGPLMACPAPRTAAAAMACCRTMRGHCMARSGEESCCQHQLIPPPPPASLLCAGAASSQGRASATVQAVTALGSQFAARRGAPRAEVSPPLPLAPLAAQSLLRI